MRQTNQPATAGERQVVPVDLALAVQRGAAWALCMRLASFFISTSLCANITHDRLAAIIDRDSFDPDGLVPARAVAAQGLHLGRKSAGCAVHDQVLGFGDFNAFGVPSHARCTHHRAVRDCDLVHEHRLHHIGRFHLRPHG